MQIHLEDLLRQKERELKLYQRFLDLRNFCETNVFPLVDLPLREHVASLTSLVERIVPDPRDRTEEMFSGEIFALLGTIYLHDIHLVKNYHWQTSGEIFENIDSQDKSLLLSYGIGRTLDIPEMAIEIINYLTFSNIVKKIPVEWEISENSRRAIIRNTKVIGHIFNFTHLLHDVFFSDLRYFRLRRFQSPRLVLRPQDAAIDINAREGVIQIGYHAKFPYEVHVLERARGLLEDMFNLFKNNVNGRLGFQYRELLWDITKDFNYDRDIFQVPKFSPYEEDQHPPFNRQEEAAEILDHLFTHGHVVVVGEGAMGKTTILKAFIIPQLLSVAPHVFYCEVWGNPVNEVRDVIGKRHRDLSYAGLDIVSMVRRLLQDGICFFVIDGCERLVGLETTEREKFDRFVEFCLDQENVYLIVCGDSESFFDWYEPFRRINLGALYRLRALSAGVSTEESSASLIFGDVGRNYKPIEFELLQANLNLDRIVEDVLKGELQSKHFREIVAILADRTDRHLRRFTVEEILFETSIPREEAVRCLALLRDKDLVKESEFLGSTYYALSSRYLKDPLNRVLKLEEFDEKKRIRHLLQHAIMNQVLLEEDVLELIVKWKDDMVFSGEALGWILSSLVAQDRDYSLLLEQAKGEGREIDIQPILRLLYLDDARKRGAAIRLLIEIQDKNMINPLLEHLKVENDRELKDLLIRGLGSTGKKRAVVAIMRTLKEIGDRDLKLRALEFFSNLFGKNASKFLGEVREKEEDPVVLQAIDDLLRASRENS